MVTVGTSAASFVVAAQANTSIASTNRGRIEQIDLNTGSPARLLQYLHDQNSPLSRALPQKFEDVADCLGLDDELLDSCGHLCSRMISVVCVRPPIAAATLAVGARRPFATGPARWPVPSVRIRPCAMGKASGIAMAASLAR